MKIGSFKEFLIEKVDLTKYKIFEDMDGCLCDFEKQYKTYFGHGTEETDQDKIHDALAEVDVEFWSEMPWTHDGKRLWNFIKEYDVTILTAPPSKTIKKSIDICRIGKIKWVKNNLGLSERDFILESAKHKYAKPNHILIDDRPKNIMKWKESGGIGVLHTRAGSTIDTLSELG